MNQTQFWIQQQTRRMESACSQAEQKVRMARSMRQVIEAAHVAIPAELRAVKNSIPGYRRLMDSITHRLTQLLDEQLKALADLAGAEHKERRGRLLSTEWCHLRGAYAPLYRRAEAESRERSAKAR